eukprot:gene22836-30010_t
MASRIKQPGGRRAASSKKLPTAIASTKVRTMSLNMDTGPFPAAQQRRQQWGRVSRKRTCTSDLEMDKATMQLDVHL